MSWFMIHNPYITGWALSSPFSTNSQRQVTWEVRPRHSQRAWHPFPLLSVSFGFRQLVIKTYQNPPVTFHEILIG